MKRAVLLTGRLYVTPVHLVFKYSLGSSMVRHIGQRR
jgi:hypothetical protein